MRFCLINTAHLKQIVITSVFLGVAGLALAAESPERYEFEYKFHWDLPTGKPVRIWIPTPIQDQFQSVEKQDVKASLPWKATSEKKFGNRFLYLEGTPKGKGVDVTVTYQVTRRPEDAFKPDIKANPHDNPEAYLKEDKHIVFSDAIRKIAETEAGQARSDIDKSSAFYDYVFRSMKYDKTGKGWGEGNAVWACTNKRGNCTDFHSLFIALNRSVGIPARFTMGFPMPPGKDFGEVPGYHCWAEAYGKSVGWFPVDASEAKNTGKQDYYFSHLPANRIAFSMGRDLVLEPPQKGEPLNFLIYPYAESDGKVVSEGLKKEFHFRKLAVID